MNPISRSAVELRVRFMETKYFSPFSELPVAYLSGKLDDHCQLSTLKMVTWVPVSSLILLSQKVLVFLSNCGIWPFMNYYKVSTSRTAHTPKDIGQQCFSGELEHLWLRPPYPP